MNWNNNSNNKLYEQTNTHEDSLNKITDTNQWMNKA